MSRDPSPPPPPSPSPNNDPASSAGSAPASAPGSTTNGAAGALFIGEPGPAFDPAAAPAPEQTAPPAVELPGWEEDSVRAILTAQGNVVHVLAGVADDDWQYTEGDLKAIAPPLTRILNRYDATRAAAGTGDELAVMFGLTGYVTRSYLTRRAVLADIAQQTPTPVTGVPAPAGTDGTNDPAAQAARGETPQWQTDSRG